MVTLLLEDPDDSLFEVEEREFPPCAPYSEIRSIMGRPDMSRRTLDSTMDHSFSLYRCVSKEIFGTESHFDFILKEVCNEITQNPTVYEAFTNQDSLPRKFQFLNLFRFTSTIEQNRNEELIQNLVLDIEDDLASPPFRDVQLLALATHFQTTIFVLSVEEDGSSIWKDYSQLRTKQKPQDLASRRHQSLCPPHRYHVTLYTSSAGHFHRIVPDTDVCCCCLAPPDVPDRQKEHHENMPINGKNVLSHTVVKKHRIFLF